MPEGAGRGRAGPAQRAAAPARAVVLPYTAKRVSPTDLAEIGARLPALDPALRFLPFDVTEPPGWLAEPPALPCVTLCLNNAPAHALVERLPGPKWVPRPLGKIEQLRRLREAGLRLPPTALFRGDLAPDRRRFGEMLIVKPTGPGTSRARGIEVIPTAEFARHRARLAETHAEAIAAGMPPVVQRYVRTGRRPTHVRVLCAFGRPILTYRTTAPEPFRPGRDRGAGAGTSNASDRRERRLEHDPRIAAFGARAARAFPETPVMGIDVIREAPGGGLYVLEANFGNIAPLSSPVCAGLRAELGAEAMLAQFSAYDVIAEGIAARAAEAARDGLSPRPSAP
jgi:hypothetical protein